MSHHLASNLRKSRPLKPLIVLPKQFVFDQLDPFQIISPILAKAYVLQALLTLL